MKLDYTQSITDNSNITLTPASAMTGGGKKQRGGGYVGVSFMPEQQISGMLGRMSYGPRCTPVFRTYPDPLYQAGGGKENPDCDCDEKESPTPMTEKEAQSASLSELSRMLGGSPISPISQFSLISASSSIFAPMNINQIISIILLLFGHAYLTRSSASPKKNSSHRDRILGGGSIEPSSTESQQKIRGGGGPLLAPILMPLGPGNLVAIAAILLLHYFATRRERMMTAMKGGSKSMESFQSESLFEKEMKIHQMLGGNSLYRELEESFLTVKPSDDLLGGGVKGKLRGTREKRKGKIAALIKPIGHEKFKAPGFIRDLKNLFRHYYYTIYKEKSSKKMAGGGLAKGKQMAHSKRAVRSFQRIYDMIAPIAVALKLKSAEKRKKMKRAVAKK